MAHLRAVNVNDAFRSIVEAFSGPNTPDFPKALVESRVGDVIQLTEPLLVTYANPNQRVLFNVARDCNPFFHLFESLWMLNGRDDVAPLNYYSSKYSTFCSDDGKTQHGAYGKRWRRWFGYDQIKEVIAELKKNPRSRRCVLSMWDACSCEDCDTKPDLWVGCNGGKDVPCNTHAYFLINQDGQLDMTVCNRSNDILFGMLGANAVHFSFLQEYIALNLGVDVGVYNQFTNNAHAYLNVFTVKAVHSWLSTSDSGYDGLTCVPLIQNPSLFDIELEAFNVNWLGRDLDDRLHINGWELFEERFLARTAYPAALAFYQHKKRKYESAMDWATTIEADDWRVVCSEWINRRWAKYQRAADDGPNPYSKNELQRLKEGNDASVNSQEE
jgi:thymidylate synthase